LAALPPTIQRIAEYRLPQQADQGMSAVLSSAFVSKFVAGKIAQAECIIELAIRK
jgi:hypothetical protein